MPREFTAAIEYAINSLLRRACSGEQLDPERIRNLLREARASNVSIDRTTLEFLLRKRVETCAAQFATDSSNIEKLQALRSVLTIAKQMPFNVNLWSAQNQIYALQSGVFVRTRRKAQRGDNRAQAWLEEYLALCNDLSIRAQ